MKKFVRKLSLRVRPWLGSAALLLGMGAATAQQPPAGQGAPVATEQLIAQADAQAAEREAASSHAACTGPHAQGFRYSVQALEVPNGGFEAFPAAINNRGWVVGYSSGPYLPQATLWIGGRAFGLPALGGIGYASDINDAGKIVGFVNDANVTRRAATWYRGRLTVLRNLPNTTSFAEAHGINRNGLIAGVSAARKFTGRAVIWKNGIPRELDSLGGGLAIANRINDLGYSVGIANPPSATVHGALWTPKGDIVDLGGQNIAVDINNAGRIVGFVGAGLPPKPLKWVRGVRTVLPTLGGENGIVYAINESDQAVGYSQTATGQERATIWFGAKPVQLDTLLDAESSGTVVDAAYAINDKGQIAAIRRLPNNRVQPLVLTPRRCGG
jgi:uncharacterized membrane protein